MIKKEVATVYRGGRRRYFTLDGAAHGAAHDKIRERCQCDTEDHGPIFGIEHITCWYHEPDNYRTLKRRLARLYKNAYRNQTTVQNGGEREG